MKRVVVTGMGAVTPIGNSVEEFWDNIKKNTVGIGGSQSLMSVITSASLLLR